MKSSQVTVVRIYLSDAKDNVEILLKRLRDWEKVRGVTVFRGISGFGDSGETHTAKWVDLALDLPIVVEFFDKPEKVENILDHIATNIKPMHMVWWSAYVNDQD